MFLVFFWPYNYLRKIKKSFWLRQGYIFGEIPEKLKRAKIATFFNATTEALNLGQTQNIPI